MAQLPELHVSDSSEAMLSGRKPPFRLLVRAVASDGRKVNIRHAVSEGFVVRASHFVLKSLNSRLISSVNLIIVSNSSALICKGGHIQKLLVLDKQQKQPLSSIFQEEQPARSCFQKKGIANTLCQVSTLAHVLLSYSSSINILNTQVATRRTRTAGKVEIPNVDDHVSKLEHMGKETVKKLNDLKLAAHQAGVEISVPRNTILKGAPLTVVPYTFELVLLLPLRYLHRPL